MKSYKKRLANQKISIVLGGGSSTWKFDEPKKKGETWWLRYQKKVTFLPKQICKNNIREKKLANMVISDWYQCMLLISDPNYNQIKSTRNQESCMFLFNPTLSQWKPPLTLSAFIKTKQKKRKKINSSVGKWFGNTLQVLGDARDPQLVTWKGMNTPVEGAEINTPTDKSAYTLLVAYISS